MIDDNELINVFIEETHDLNALIQSQLTLWQSNPHQNDIVGTILREMHTLKGNARMMGLTELSEFLHCLEQLWQMIQQEQVNLNEEFIESVVMLTSFIDKYTYELDQTKKEPDIKFPLAEIKNFITEESDPVLLHHTEKTKAQQALLENTNRNIKPSLLFSDNIRVKSEILDKWADFASEINADRARCEQQNKNFLQLLFETGKELKFVQDQVKQLQIKVDANIKSQTVVEHTISDHEFDILEMDYYTYQQQLVRTLSDKILLIQDINNRTILSTRRHEQVLRNQTRVSRLLEEDIRHTRLVSLDYIVPRLEYTVTSLSEELGKHVKFKCVNLGGEIDRKIIDKLIAPLEHLLRNSIDHGVETPDVRLQKKKSESGLITLTMLKQGNHVVIDLADDGKGIDVEEIKKVALKNHLWDGQSSLSDQQLLQMIFLSGFTTKKVATEISGHGVGLDVVSNEISKLGGTVSVSSEINKGTIFRMSFPIELSLTQTLLFYIGDQIYAVPLSQLSGIQRLPYQMILPKLNALSDKIKLKNHEYALFSLPLLLDPKTDLKVDSHHQMMPILLFHTVSHAIGLVVDKLIGSAEIVAQPMSAQLKFIKEINGVSATGSGEIILILDVLQLLQQVLHTSFEFDLNRLKVPFYQKDHVRQNSILVVDDSNTVRQVLSRFLQRHAYFSQLASNGEEALHKMKISAPDLVLLDLEMPLMNGYEVLKSMRADPLLAQIPVVIITSRSGEKHYLRAMESGANAYVSKPYRESELLAIIQKLIMR